MVNSTSMHRFLALMLLLSTPAMAQDWIFRDSFEDIAIWISQVSGNWGDGFNWKSGSPPADGEAVIIDVPTEVEVTMATGPRVLSSIVSEELLHINTTLTVNGPILNNGGMTISGELINAYVLPSSTQGIVVTSRIGGSIIRNVRMGGTISSGMGNRSSLNIVDGLTLDGAIVVWGARGVLSRPPLSTGIPPT